MIMLYIKKPINNFRDLSWLNNEINFRTGKNKYPVVLKVNLELPAIQKMMKVMYINKDWSITSINSKEGKITIPNGNFVKILTQDNVELKLTK